MIADLDLALFAYTIAAFGLAYVVGHASISQRPREWLAGLHRAGLLLVELLECPACFGFWTGALVESVGLWPQSIPGHAPWIARILYAGLYTSGSNLILALATGIIARPE